MLPDNEEVRISQKIVQIKLNQISEMCHFLNLHPVSAQTGIVYVSTD